MPYSPDPEDGAAPLDGEKASTAAAEFRALKTYIQDEVIDTLIAGKMALNPTSILCAGAVQAAGYGAIGGSSIAAGSGTRSGYLSIIKPDGTRKGYIGDALGAGGMTCHDEDGAAWTFTTAIAAPNIGTNASGAKTISSALPSGGTDGDIWYQVV